MLVAAFGAPTILSDLGFRVVRAILESRFAQSAHIEANTTDDFRIAWTQAEGKAIALTCNSPDEELASLFVASGAPLLLFWSSGSEITADHVRFGTDFRSSVRFASKYMAVLDAISVAPTATIFTWPDPDTELVQFVTEIAEAARLHLSTGEISLVVGRIAPGYQVGDRVKVRSVVSPRSVLSSIVADKTPEAIPLLAGLPDVLGHSDDGPRERLTTKSVPAQYFSIFGRDAEPATMPVDLAGGARILINGPLLHFLPGNWTAIPRFRIGGNRPSNAFYFDIVCGYDVFGGTLKLPPEGDFSCELPFVVPSAINPVEVRFRIVEGAISGWFELLHVHFKSGHDDHFYSSLERPTHRLARVVPRVERV